MMKSIFDKLTPELCGLSPARFEAVKNLVLHQIPSVNIRNTTKEQQQQQQEPETSCPGSYDAIAGGFV